MEINLNLAVITTRFVLEENSTIVYVTHDEDGYWQFFGEEEGIEEGDGRITSLGEIIEMDPTIKDILDIPEGGEAWRSKDTKEWTTSNNEE